MQETIICRITESPFRYIGWPTVTQDEKGVLYVVCSGHRLSHICPFGQNWLFISDDQGASWRGPIIINDTVLDDRDTGLLYRGNGKMMMMAFNHPPKSYDDWDEIIKNITPKDSLLIAEGMKNYWKVYEAPYGSFTKTSLDYGKTWSERRPAPLTSPHGPIELPDGTLLHLGKEFYSGLSIEKDHIYCAKSKNDGKNWEIIGQVPLPDGLTENNLHEPAMLLLPDGTLLGFIRVDANNRMTMVKTFSYDGGKTWTKPEKTGYCGAPPHLILTSRGDVLLTYGRRENPFGECVRVSSDGGKTFGEEKYVSYGPNGDLGYPATTELADGSFYTVYYQQVMGDAYPSLVGCRWRMEE